MEIASLQDLQQMKEEILEEIRAIKNGNPETPPKWVKSKKAREILGCSPGTLQNLRQNGSLMYSKIGGTLYYSRDSIIKSLEQNKRNVLNS